MVNCGCNGEHWCHECRHHSYDTVYNETDCKKGNAIVSGRETDCKDWECEYIGWCQTNGDKIKELTAKLSEMVGLYEAEKLLRKQAEKEISP